MKEFICIEDLWDWLDALPKGSEAEQDRVRQIEAILAHRSAMRVLPLAWDWLHRSADIRDRDFTECTVLWPSLISGIALNIPDSALSLDSDTAARAAYAAAEDDAADYTKAAYREGTFAGAQATYSVAAATHAGAVSAVVHADRVGDFWWVLSKDCELLKDGGDCMERPLWHDAENDLANVWADLVSDLSAAPADQGWRFWIDWYERALTGQPQEWPLLKQVAEIDAKHWRAGPAAVWAQIQELMDRDRLLTRVRELESQLAEARAQDAALAHRSHNNPPELLDDVTVQLEEAAPYVEAALSSAGSELEKGDPDPKALSTAGKQIKDALDAFDQWCGERAMIFIDSLMKEAGSQIAKTLAFFIKTGALAAVAEWLLKLS